MGGEIRTGVRVERLAELPPARAVLFDVAPSALLRIAGDALSRRYRARLGRFRHGPGIFKLDWALAAPIPWRDARCREAITVHLQSLPAQVTGLVFTVNSYSGQRFTDVAAAYCRLLDATTGAELVRFDLTRAEPHTGVLMCKLVRMQSGEWVMTALEEYVDSRTVRGMVKPGARAL